MIDNYISTLLDHPMAFFEHFSQTLSPEVLNKIQLKSIDLVFYQAYDRVTKLLEAELLRSNGEEQIAFADEQKDVLSLSPSAPLTRPETSNSEKTFPELIPAQAETTLVIHILNIC